MHSTCFIWREKTKHEKNSLRINRLIIEAMSQAKEKKMRKVIVSSMEILQSGEDRFNWECEIRLTVLPRAI